MSSKSRSPSSIEKILTGQKYPYHKFNKYTKYTPAQLKELETQYYNEYYDGPSLTRSILNDDREENKKRQPKKGFFSRKTQPLPSPYYMNLNKPKGGSRKTKRHRRK